MTSRNRRDLCSHKSERTPYRDELIRLDSAALSQLAFQEKG